MATDPNDRSLRDPALDAAWRAHSHEEPPAHLDAAILAAAHRAAAPNLRDVAAEARSPWQWWWPLAAAATIGAVAIGVIQLLPSDKDAATTVVSDMPRGAPATRDRAAQPPLAPAREADAGARAPAAGAEAPAPAPVAPQAPAPVAPASVAKPPQVSAALAGKPAPPVPASVAPPPAVRQEQTGSRESSDAVAGRVAANATTAQVPAEAPPSASVSKEQAPAAGPAPASVSKEQPPAVAPVPASAPKAQAPAAPPAPSAPPAPLAKEGPDPFPGQKTTQAAEPPPAPAPLQAAPSTPAEEERKGERQSEGLGGGMRARRADTARPAPAPGGVGAGAPATPSFAPAPRDPAESRERSASSGATLSMLEGAPGAPQAKQRSVDDWIATLRRLRAEGRYDEAAKELAAFRAAYPDADARLPADMRGWALGVRR